MDYAWKFLACVKERNITGHIYGKSSPEGLDQGYTHGFVMTFADATARDSYLKHPDHEKFKAAALPHELERLEARAGRAGAGARGLVEWAAQEHADVFVELGQVSLRRERVIREANELATMLLGEPTFGSTAAQVRARVEATLP